MAKIKPYSTIDDFFLLLDTNQIVGLKMVVGNEQIAGTTIRLGTKNLGSFANSFETILDPQQYGPLAGNILKFTTKIEDISPETDLTTLIVTITQGTISRSWSLQAYAKPAGSIVSYYGRIEFL